ncbi:MAG TPA: class I SAM-dependent methyltransferase [Verrucomicrobiae bacterium]
MRDDHLIQRRHFIRTTSAVGAIGVLNGLGLMTGLAGAAAAGAVSKSTANDRVLRQLDAIAREFPTAAKEEAQFLGMLVRLSRAKRVLEIGTAYGYTTIWLGLALAETGGKLTTIEIAPERAEVAKQHVAAAGLSKYVNFRLGDAHAILPALGGSFDIAYLDADKGGNEDYFNKLFPKKLPPGGLLVAHNAVLLAEKMKDYLERVRQHPEFDTLIISATPDDGLALSYRARGRD